MSAGLYPADDDASPRADTQRAIRRIEKERAAGVILPVGLAMGAAVREDLTLSTGLEVLLVAVLAALCFIYVAICGARIDALKAELRSLPSRFS